MRQGHKIILFYANIVVLILSTAIHELYSNEITFSGSITNIVQLASILSLLGLTGFVLRPQIKSVTASMTLMQNTLSQLKLLETVIQEANDGVIITKADLSDPGPEIIYVNEAFTRISGYTSEEVIGKNPRFLQSEFTKRETLDAMRQALIEGRSFKDELLNRHKNGSNYWLDISVVPIRNDNGVVTHYAAIERDISARKTNEIEYKNMWVQLKRANLKAEAVTKELENSLRKAEEANKAKSDFLANMSHELRTPMNGVLGMSNLLADTELDEDQRMCVSTINSSGESLLMLLNDILDFSKIEAGALTLEHLAFGTQEFFTSATQMLQPNAHKKGIELLVDMDEAIPSYMMGDPGRLRQVVINLLGNSIKFTNAGYVRLSARLTDEKEATLLHVRVEDTGIGIPHHKLGEIFDKFTQADASITRKYGGTGLGLAITKQLITMMGGTVGVESVEGKGSTFWFSIPCIRAEQNDIEKLEKIYRTEHVSARARIEASAAKVLLVEDFMVNQLFAKKLLAKFGFTNIDLAENGAEALLKYRSQGYDVIFMDCQMPEMDGYQTTVKIREIETDTPLHTPIIAMTANAMMGDREKCLKSGMDDYISKPLRAEHLRAILQSMFILSEEAAAASSAKKQLPTAIAANSEEPAVDLEQLRMFTGGDLSEERELSVLFLEQANEIIATLQNNLANDKCEIWKSAAHRFKGSSGNLGAVKLHQLCKIAESHFEDATPTKQDMLSAMIEETKRVEQFFSYVNVAA